MAAPNGIGQPPAARRKPALWIIGGVGVLAVVGLVLGLTLGGFGPKSDRDQISEQFYAFYDALDGGDAAGALSRACFDSQDYDFYAKQFRRSVSGEGVDPTIEEIGIDREVAVVKYYSRSFPNSPDFAGMLKDGDGWCVLITTEYFTYEQNQRYVDLKRELDTTRSKSR